MRQEIGKTPTSYPTLSLSSVGDLQEFAIADPCPYHVKYSPDVFKKKTKNLATYNTDKSYLFADP